MPIVISGCGYSNKSLIAQEGSVAIFVEGFRNKIDISREPSSRHRYNVYKPFLEVKITNAIIDRFLYEADFKVTDLQSADLVLKGELVNFLRQPLKYSDSKEIQEYRLNVMINFTLKDLRTGKILLEEKNLTADTTYFVTGRAATTEDSAIQVLLEDVARRTVNRIAHQW